MSTEPEPKNISTRSGGADLDAQGDVNVGGDVVGRDKIINTTINVYPSAEEKPQPSEKRFLIGNQLRIAREDTGLQPTAFVDLIDFPSEQQYRAMEANQIECPESVVNRIYEVTGILPGWFKDPTQPKYEVEAGSRWFSDPQETARYIARPPKQLIWVTIAAAIPVMSPFVWYVKNRWADMWHDAYLHVGVCVQIGQYRYRLFDTGFCAKFGDAYFRERYALPFYLFLQELVSPFEMNCFGTILSDFKADRDLYWGRIYPGQVVGNSKASSGFNWLMTVLDQENRPAELHKLARLFGGWIEDMQRVFLEVRRAEH